MKNVRVTKGGMVILAVLAAAVVVATVASGGVRFVAAAVIALIALILVGEGLSGGGTIRSEAARKQEVLSKDAKRRFDHGP
jgi:hypothetical protein